MDLYRLQNNEAINKIYKTWKIRKFSVPAVFILVFVAPVLDEIIGGFQFRSLCSKEVIFVVDEKNVRGKTVSWMEMPDNK